MNEKTFTCQLITCEMVLYTGEVQSIILPSKTGNIQLLLNHTPCISVLRPGITYISSAKEDSFFLFGGACMMDGKRATILSPRAIKLKDIHSETLSSLIMHFQSDLKKEYVSFFKD
jgi:F-type H+-transporting ATPase subunit epsilon